MESTLQVMESNESGKAHKKPVTVREACSNEALKEVAGLNKRKRETKSKSTKNNEKPAFDDGIVFQDSSVDTVQPSTNSDDERWQRHCSFEKIISN